MLLGLVQIFELGYLDERCERLVCRLVCKLVCGSVCRLVIGCRLVIEWMGWWLGEWVGCVGLWVVAWAGG